MRALTHKRSSWSVAATVLCLGALLLLGDAAVVPDAGWSSTGSVQVTAVVGSTIDVSFADGSVTVRSNVPWQVSAYLADGEQVAFFGGPTAGHEVVLPDGAIGTEVFAR